MRPPKLLQPNPTSETRSPDTPKLRLSINSSSASHAQSRSLTLPERRARRTSGPSRRSASSTPRACACCMSPSYEDEDLSHEKTCRMKSIKIRNIMADP
jgi:hypothetical protein